jgi:hypothetical protein
MVAIAEDENSIHNIVEKWSEWEIFGQYCHQPPCLSLEESITVLLYSHYWNNYIW